MRAKNKFARTVKKPAPIYTMLIQSYDLRCGIISNIMVRKHRRFLMQWLLRKASYGHEAHLGMSWLMNCNAWAKDNILNKIFINWYIIFKL